MRRRLPSRDGDDLSRSARSAALADLTPYFETLKMKLLRIDFLHVLANVTPKPPTRDPFDNLLLAQCQVEGLRLVTVDHALSEHPLALNTF